VIGKIHEITEGCAYVSNDWGSDWGRRRTLVRNGKRKPGLNRGDYGGCGVMHYLDNQKKSILGRRSGGAALTQKRQRWNRDEEDPQCVKVSSGVGCEDCIGRIRHRPDVENHHQKFRQQSLKKKKEKGTKKKQNVGNRY